MNKKAHYLCVKCADSFRIAYDVKEVQPKGWFARQQSKASCENCGKRIYGSYYEITKKEK